MKDEENITELDCRGEQERIKSAEDLEEVNLDSLYPTKRIKIGKN